MSAAVAKRESVSRPVTVWNGAVSRQERELVEEIRCPVLLNGENVGELCCSPWDLEEAAVGLLYTGGRIRGMEEVESLEVDREIRVRTRSRTAERRAAAAPLRLTPEQVSVLARGLEERSELFHRTGGVHCAAVSRGEGFLVYREDVSRRAAVDKAAGACLVEGIPMEGTALVFSGRVPGEILGKAAVMGCAVVIARSAPTDRAVSMAEEAGITLIAFARDDSFTVYTCPERVQF